MSGALLGVLVVVALVAGVGITAVGPGGIALTAALYALTPLSADQIAGTASATFVASGLLGSAAYHRSGELAGAARWQMAGILSVASIVGALVGVRINYLLPLALFGALLGLFTAAAGASILWREHRAGRATTPAPRPVHGATLAAVGAAVGLAGATLGVGGPVLAVPALVLLGVPMLQAVAVAQVQSVVISLLATVGYARHGSVLWPAALLLGVPLVIGALLGWKVAQVVDPSRLRIALGLALIAIGVLLPLLPRG